MINDGNSDLTFDYQDWILKGDNGKVQAVKQLLESVNVSESYDTFIGYRTPEDGSIYVTDVNFEASTNTFTFTFNDGSTVIAQITSTGEGGSVDLTPYAKTAEVDAKIAEATEGLATEDYVTQAIAGIEFPIIPEVPTKTSELENDSDFITSAEVDEKIAAIEGGDTPAYDDTEIRNLIAAETEARSAADTQLQADIEAEAQARIEGDANAVKYQEFNYNDQVRKTIQLANYDSISGVGTDGVGYNIAMVSKWDKVDLGAGGLPINLNGNAARPTYNDDKEIALLEDITDVPTKLSQLENDTNFVTADDLAIPTKTSELINDSNFITAEDVTIPTNVSELTNDANYVAYDSTHGMVLPENASISAVQVPDTGSAGVILAQRTYDEGVTHVTEVGNVRNKLTLNATERPQIDLTGGTQEKLAYLSDIEGVSVPTAVSELTNDMGYQTESDVNNRIKSMIGAAPEALDTLVEIAQALDNDPNFATTITNQLANKADKTEIPDISNLATKEELATKAEKTEVTKLATDVDYIGNTLIPQMNTNTANALGTKVDWDSEKKVISLPKDGSVAALQNEDTLEGANLLAQRTYDEGTTYVTEVGSTKNKLTLNASERPQIDIQGGSSEKIAYESDLKYISHLVNFPLRTLKDKVYTQSEILAWFGVEDIPTLKGIIASGGIQFLRYGISLSTNPHYYKMPIDYVAFESANQIKLAFTGLNTNNDRPAKYEILMNLDGAILENSCNVQISMTEIPTTTTILGDLDASGYFENGYSIQVLNKLEESYISDLGTPENVNGQPYNAETNNYLLGQPYLSFAKFDESFVFHYDLYILNGDYNLGYFDQIYRAIKVNMDTYDSKLSKLEERIAALEGAGA